MRRQLLAIATVTATVVIGFGGVAHALPTAYVFGRNGAGEIRASATYDDAPNRFCVSDRFVDDHSGVVQYKRQSTAGWDTSRDTFEVWDHDGANDSSACMTVHFLDNTPLVMRVCVGEWSEHPNRRVILRNSEGGPWCGPTRKFLS
jgi:hypothetical protein